MTPESCDRRAFLKKLAYSSLVLGLPFSGGCEPQIPPGIADTAVSMVHDQDDAVAVRSALELINGLDFISRGDSVLLKLALNSYSPFPATTSPFMISEIIRALKDAGAGDVFVGDKTPFWHDKIGGTIGCMQRTGIYQAIVDAGGDPVVFEEDAMVPVNPPGTRHWPAGFSMPALFARADHIIALPTLRTHQLADFTMGMKIFVGAIPQEQRFVMHNSKDFLKCIAEIALCTDKIRLCVLDARQGFNTGGPDDGNLVAPGIVIAGRNLAAVDAAGLALLKTIGTTERIMGMSVWDHPTIRRGVEAYAPELSGATIDLRAEGIELLQEIKQQLGA